MEEKEQEPKGRERGKKENLQKMREIEDYRKDGEGRNREDETRKNRNKYIDGKKRNEIVETRRNRRRM